ncbi:hypothetical protein, partial [Ornithinimicrobium sp. CNJ-824]|uniref:hypothetical protein n=1 Tax=Ornithinimicrobium sp. CNJ-824 TaxID=1904966 RepID=UPI001EDA8441
QTLHISLVGEAKEPKAMCSSTQRRRTSKARTAAGADGQSDDSGGFAFAYLLSRKEICRG